MKNVSLKIAMVLTVAVFLFACNNETADPALVLDEVFIPAGFSQSDAPDLEASTLLQELRLENPDDQFYYLQLIDGPVSDHEKVLFPQKELLIEYVDKAKDSESQKKTNYRGVIVKKIKGDWQEEEFKVFDTPAQPEGGMQELFTALSENIVYPEAAKKAGIEGKVFVEFVVGKNGELKDIVVKKGINAECDAEAVRALKEAVKWQPAKVMDKPVEVKMILPINYKLG